jgi:hypothetical protein
MNFLRLLSIIISFIILAAHFMHAGQMNLVYLMLALPFLLFFKKSWVPWFFQAVLLLGAVEWLRTLYFMTQVRIEYGEPWMRMAIILGAVALFTALSSLMFWNKKLSARYSNK